jgi:hypothetical protein
MKHSTGPTSTGFVCHAILFFQLLCQTLTTKAPTRKEATTVPVGFYHTYVNLSQLCLSDVQISDQFDGSASNAGLQKSTHVESSHAAERGFDDYHQVTQIGRGGPGQFSAQHSSLSSC